MDDEKLRELSKDFLKSNVLYRFISIDGIIKHRFKNGKERKIDLFKRLVTISDNNGNVLFSNVLESEHPLIKCANLYYKFRYLKRHAKVGYMEYRKLEREKNFLLANTEEIFQLA